MMKYFNKGRILLLLLPFLFTLQDAYAENMTAPATNQQSTPFETSPAGTNTLIDGLKNIFKSIENLILFRSKKHENPKSTTDERESEGVTYSFYDYDNKYEEPIHKKPSRIIPRKHTKKIKEEE